MNNFSTNTNNQSPDASQPVFQPETNMDEFENTTNTKKGNKISIIKIVIVAVIFILLIAIGLFVFNFTQNNNSVNLNISTPTPTAIATTPTPTPNSTPVPEITQLRKQIENLENNNQLEQQEVIQIKPPAIDFKIGL